MIWDPQARPTQGSLENLKGLANVSVARGLRSLEFLEAPEGRPGQSLRWRVAGGLIESHIAPAFANSFGPAFWEMPCIQVGACIQVYDRSRRQPRARCHHQRHEKLRRSTHLLCIRPSWLLLKQQHPLSGNPTAADRTAQASRTRSWIPPGSD